MTEDNKINEWNNFLKRQYSMPDNFKLIDTNNSEENIWKTVAVLLGVVFILEIAGLGVYFGYLGYNDKFKSETLIDNINNIDTPDVNVTNEYEHIIHNNITVIVNLPENINVSLQNGSVI